VRPVPACQKFTGHTCTVASSILEAGTH
jgi:hypothetical protein